VARRSKLTPCRAVLVQRCRPRLSVFCVPWHSLKSNEMAQCSFQPQQPLVCDSFKNCAGLSRVAFMDGNGVVMLGKVISCERKEEAAGGGKKK